MEGEDTTALDARLEEFLERLTPSLSRPKQRRNACTYVAGLLLDGERKSVQPLAGRLGATDNGQALHHFVAHSPWACEGLFLALAQEAARLWPRPHAWIIDETSFPRRAATRWAWLPSTAGHWARSATARWR